MRKLILLIAVGLAGCATVKNNYVPVTQQISFPALNEVRTASLGEELVRQGTATTTMGAYLPQQNNIRGIVLSEGFYPQTGEDDEYIYTSFAIGNAAPGFGKITISGLAGSLPQGIRFSKEKQQTCLVVSGIYGIPQNSCDTEWPYQITERPFISENDFQQTLIYSGRVGDRIKISYREFSGGMARAAFSNEAEYDLSESNVIAYRGARIRVISADNQTIEYEVLSNFNTK